MKFPRSLTCNSNFWGFEPRHVFVSACNAVAMFKLVTAIHTVPILRLLPGLLMAHVQEWQKINRSWTHKPPVKTQQRKWLWYTCGIHFGTSESQESREAPWLSVAPASTSMDQGWNGHWQGKPEVFGENFARATSSSTDWTWTFLGFKPGLRNDKPTTQSP
jgi:hypothetical protein